MAITKCCVLLLVPLVAVLVAAADQLRVDCYSETCPNVEAIVREEMERVIAAAPSLAGPLLRLHFHDCFVRGCDASVLLSSTGGNTAERDAKPNKSLRGFGSVERVKARLEAALPPADGDIPTLARVFASNGLDLKDLAVLSGAHTLGTAHCPSYAGRHYNFRAGASPTTPACRRRWTPAATRRSTAATTAMSPSGGGLFSSDASLLTDATTRDYVQRIATGEFDAIYSRVDVIALFNGSEFFRDFGESMTKMGNVAVLTGADGEIRKKCYVIN
uniref:Plant heme peroxidase family profile domain-containing protein n=1 Tax=Oryza meridionalis TaxID=40149 RepID=A0A0E0E247_9ORYZ